MTKREAYDELIKLLNTNVDSAQVEGIILLLCNYFTTDDLKGFINYIKEEHE